MNKSEWIIEWLRKQIAIQMSEWILKQIRKQIGEQMSEWIIEWIREQLSEQMSEWIIKWIRMNHWANWWTNEWTNYQKNQSSCLNEFNWLIIKETQENDTTSDLIASVKSSVFVSWCLQVEFPPQLSWDRFRIQHNPDLHKVLTGDQWIHLQIF